MSNKKKITPIVSVASITIEQVEKTNLSKPMMHGNYTLVALKNGKEFGDEFTITARQYNKTFKDNPRFKVKKNPQ